MAAGRKVPNRIQGMPALVRLSQDPLYVQLMFLGSDCDSETFHLLFFEQMQQWIKAADVWGSETGQT